LRRSLAKSTASRSRSRNRPASKPGGPGQPRPPGRERQPAQPCQFWDAQSAHSRRAPPRRPRASSRRWSPCRSSRACLASSPAPPRRLPAPPRLLVQRVPGLPGGIPRVRVTALRLPLAVLCLVSRPPGALPDLFPGPPGALPGFLPGMLASLPANVLRGPGELLAQVADRVPDVLGHLAGDVAYRLGE